MLVSGSYRILTRGSELLMGENIMRKAMKRPQKPYQFGNWKPPKGYSLKKVTLSKASAYLLRKEGGDHSRIVYQIHGGGYVGQFSNLYNRTAVHFSKLYQDADVLSLDYRVYPAVHPAALEDAEEGYQWILKKGYSSKNILLCGESAGAGLCLGLTLKLRDQKDPLPGMLILSSPWADMTASGPSYKEKVQEDVLFGTLKGKVPPRYPVPILYAGTADLKDPYLSPVYGKYHNFPPMLIQTGEAELLKSDSDCIVEKAKQVGRTVQYYTYPGMYHTFYITHPKLPESRVAWKRIADWIQNRNE